MLIIPWCKSFQAFSTTNINWAYRARTCSVLSRQFCLLLVKFPDIPQRVSPALLDGQEASWFYLYSTHPWFTVGTSPGTNFLKLGLWEQRNAGFCYFSLPSCDGTGLTGSGHGVSLLGSPPRHLLPSSLACPSSPVRNQPSLKLLPLCTDPGVLQAHLKVKKVKVLVTQSCPTLWEPTDCSPPGSSVLGTLQARLLGWLAIPFSSGSFRPRDHTQLSHFAGRFFTVWATRETSS